MEGGVKTLSSQSKTEKATPKKRRDERKEGNVFQSTDVANVGFLLSAVFALSLLFPMMYTYIKGFMQDLIALSAQGVIPSRENINSLSSDFVITAVIAFLPFGLICALVSVLLHGVQTRFLFSSKVLAPKLNRLSPLQGAKKVFSLKNLVELIKNVLKVILLVYIAYTMLTDYSAQVVKTMYMDIDLSTSMIFELATNMILRILLVFTAVAFLDYLFQRWEYERKIMMSKQEVKEEFKQTEGNPEIKGKIKEMQRIRARSRMIQAVPSADVIIRNPTHFAVALKYDSTKNRAPVVIAKGQDELALRIIKVATENDVSVIENVPLARALYATTDLNREILEEHYTAVAEILSYIYMMNKKMMR